MSDYLLRKIDEACRARFESAWLAKSMPNLAEFLPAPDHDAFAATLEELVHIDLEFRYKRWADQQVGNEPTNSVARPNMTFDRSPKPPSETIDLPPNVESYLRRFPKLEQEGAKDRLRKTLETLRRQYPVGTVGEATSQAVHAGRSQIGHYELLDVVGEGGFGVVWRARDQRLGRVVAFKRLDDRLSRDESMLRRFYREGRITAQLQHPGIVPLHDISDQPESSPFYTMKLVEGETLAAAIGRHHRRGEDDGESATTQGSSPRESRMEHLRLLRAYLSIAQTMEYAHANGVIHRDLKPQNIILGGFGETVILDGGLAKVWNAEADADASGVELPLDDSTSREITRMGTIQGTPAFMSPGLARSYLAAGEEAAAVTTLGQNRDANPAAFSRRLTRDVEQSRSPQAQEFMASWQQFVAPVRPRFAGPPAEAALLNGGFELGLAAHWGTAPSQVPRSVWWNHGGARSSAIADSSIARTGEFSLRIRH